MLNDQIKKVESIVFIVNINSQEIKGLLNGTPIEWTYSSSHPYFEKIFSCGEITGGVNNIFFEQPSLYYSQARQTINHYLISLDKENDKKILKSYFQIHGKEFPGYEDYYPID